MIDISHDDRLRKIISEYAERNILILGDVRLQLLRFSGRAKSICTSRSFNDMSELNSGIGHDNLAKDFCGAVLKYSGLKDIEFRLIDNGFLKSDAQIVEFLEIDYKYEFLMYKFSPDSKFSVFDMLRLLRVCKSYAPILLICEAESDLSILAYAISAFDQEGCLFMENYGDSNRINYG